MATEQDLAAGFIEQDSFLTGQEWAKGERLDIPSSRAEQGQPVTLSPVTTASQFPVLEPWDM